MPPILRTIATWLVGLVVAAVAVLAIAHVFLSPVNPAQPAPAKHYGKSCVWCHSVTASVPVRTTK